MIKKIRNEAATVRMLALLAFIFLAGAGQTTQAQAPTPTPTPLWTQSGTNINNTNTGNVGVGTTNPLFKFEVRGAPSRNSMALIGDGDGVGFAGLKIAAMTSTGIPTNRTSSFNFHMRKDTWYGGDGSGPSFVIETASPVGGFAAPFLITPTNDVILNGGRGNAGLSYGNVGIGTTAPGFKLDVQAGAINSAGGLCINGDCKTAWSQVTGISSQWTTNGSNIFFNTGNVGLGTATPGFRFDVQGGAVNASGGLCIAGDCKTAWSQVTGAPSQWTTAGSSIHFSGNVGIGTTTPANKLHVSGGARVDGQFGKVYLGVGAVAGARGLEFVEQSPTTFSIRHHNPNVAWNNIALNPEGGNVGVGTLNPSVKLTVGGAGANVFYTDMWVENNLHVQGPEALAQGGRGRLRVGTAWGYGGLFTEPSSSGASNDLVLGASSGLVRIGPGGASVNSLVVPNGNVGIGTVAPSFRLDVQGGAVNASGGLCIAGVCKSSWAEVGGGGTGTPSQWTTGGSGIFFDSGTVGIGTNNPRGKLEVAGGSIFLGDMGQTGWGNMIMRGRVISANNNIHLSPPGGTTVYINSDFREAGGAAGPVNLEVSGTITGGNIQAKYQDLAEWVPSTQELEPGTVVVLDDSRTNHVLASTKAYDTSVAGVISAEPGVILGVEGEGMLKVATTGRVKIKVDATRGPIKVGDLLVTSDVAGVAMKSIAIDLAGTKIHRPGTIIGKALQPLDKGVGEILVLLSLQ